MNVLNLLLVIVFIIECSGIVHKSRNEVKDSKQSASEYNSGGRVRFEDDDYDTEDDFQRRGQRIKFDGPVNVLPDSPTSISFVRHDIPVIGYRRAHPNVQVEATYRNLEHTSRPVYKQVIVTEVQDDGLRHPLPRNVIVPREVSERSRYVEKEPRHQERSHSEYASKTMIKYPDGYSKGENIRTEERSRYKQDSRTKQARRKPPIVEVGTTPEVRYSNPAYVKEIDRRKEERSQNRQDVKRKKAYKKLPIIEVGTSPEVRYTKPAKNSKTVKNQPLEEASSGYGGSYIAEDIDDGGYVDGGYVDGGYVDGGFVENYGRGYDKGRHFEKEGGKKYEAAHHAEEGVKGDKGYSAEHGYEKGESAKHGVEENKGELIESEGEKKSHVDAGTKFAGGHKKAVGAKGDNFVQKTGHRKGHKKTGFHRVHHKDEYKNDEEFFDEELDSGEEKKQGHSHVEHNHAEGGNENVGHHDSAYLEKQKGQKGEQEKGQSYNQEEGFKGEKGHESHHADNSEFSKKGGYKEGEVHKHSDVGGGGIIY